jgi:hypothetical protein
VRIISSVSSIAISIVILGMAACGRSGSSGGEKVIKSTTSGDTTVALSSAGGEIKSGENDLTLSFTDKAGNPVNVTAASLKFHMPAMGAMAEMNDMAALTTTDTNGKFRAHANIEVSGSWEAMISFQRPNGTEQVTMSVTVK